MEPNTAAIADFAIAPVTAYASDIDEDTVIGYDAGNNNSIILLAERVQIVLKHGAHDRKSKRWIFI